eukprot:2948989-Pleurochrysis_carterae.AAC.1
MKSRRSGADRARKFELVKWTSWGHPHSVSPPPLALPPQTPQPGPQDQERFFPPLTRMLQRRTSCACCMVYARFCESRPYAQQAASQQSSTLIA